MVKLFHPKVQKLIAVARYIDHRSLQSQSALFAKHGGICVKSFQRLGLTCGTWMSGNLKHAGKNKCQPCCFIVCWEKAIKNLSSLLSISFIMILVTGCNKASHTDVISGRKFTSMMAKKKARLINSFIDYSENEINDRCLRFL